MRATLEVESCLIKPVMVGNITSEPEETTVSAVSYSSGNQATANISHSMEQPLVQAMDKLALRMSQLEERMTHKKFNEPKATFKPSYRQQVGDHESTSVVICFRCGKEGYYARGCALRHPSRPQGNERPPLP